MSEQAHILTTDEGSIRIHQLKTWTEYFDAVVNPDPRQRKTVEIRKNDRDYQVGDYLSLSEYDPNTKQYGRMTYRLITHMLNGQPWLPEGYVALSIMEDAPQVRF